MTFIAAEEQRSPPVPPQSGPMSWTDDRIEMLRRLWLDGLSASTIAREMGGAITRNAVIGKVHRMGLAGRAKTPSQVPTRPRAKAASGNFMASTGGAPMSKPAPSLNSGRSSSLVGARSTGMPMVSGSNALAASLSPLASPAEQIKPQLAEEVVIPISERVTIMELREAMCKWPLGDPMHADFRYCGAKAPPGGAPYCASHARIAYQPTQDRRAKDRKQLRIG